MLNGLMSISTNQPFTTQGTKSQTTKHPTEARHRPIATASKASFKPSNKDVFSKSKAGTSAARSRSHTAHPIQNRATIGQIMAKNPDGSFENVLYHRGQNVYFQIDPNETRYVTREECATQDRNAGKVIKRDGHHQIIFTTSFLPDEGEEAQDIFFVRLKGPIIWPLHRNMIDPLNDEEHAQFHQEWQKMLAKYNIEYKINPTELPKPRAKPMELIVSFNKLTPDGFTDELDIFPTAHLPKLWAKHAQANNISPFPREQGAEHEAP